MTQICWGQDDRQASDAKPREPPWPPWSCKSIHLISRVGTLEFMAPVTLFDVDIGRNVAFRPAKEARFSALDKRLAAEAVLFVSIVKRTGFLWGEAGSLWYWIWILDQHNHVESSYYLRFGCTWGPWWRCTWVFTHLNFSTPTSQTNLKHYELLAKDDILVLRTKNCRLDQFFRE